jgi:hypothetical protein
MHRERQPSNDANIRASRNAAFAIFQKRVVEQTDIF